MKSKIFEQDTTFFQKVLKSLGCFSDQDFLNPQITLSEYIQVYSRIAFNFLLLIIIFLCGFLGFNFGGREFRIEDDLGQYFGGSIFGLSLIFVLYNFTNKSREVCDRLFIIYNILVDIWFGVLAYDTNYLDKSFPFFLRILYFYMLAATIFLLYRYQTSTKELVLFIIYKFAGLLILIFTNNHTTYYIDFIFEFGFMIFWIISIFIYKQLREDYLQKSVEFFTEQKYENQYYQGLINMINKSFLSLNISTFTLKFNNPFENFLKVLGLTEEEIEFNLKEQINNPKSTNLNNLNENNNNNVNNFQNKNNFNTVNNQINNNNNNFNNTNNVSNINLAVNDINKNSNNFNGLVTAQGQGLEMTTQNDINYNLLVNSNNNLNNVMNSNALVPLNQRNLINNQVSYNKLNSNSNNNTFINQANNFNNFSNLNVNSYNNNKKNSNNLNRNNFGNNFNIPSVSNYDVNNNNQSNSSGAKNSNLNSGKNNNGINFGNNFTFLNQANNNLRNNLNPKTTDRVYLNNSNIPLNNKNNANQQSFPRSNMNMNNQNLNSSGERKLNKNIIFNKRKVNDEDSFINKLDYILNVFVYFYEEPNNNFNNSESNNNNNVNNNFNNQTPNFTNFSSNNNNNQVRGNMSEAIREIFYSRYKLDLNDGFIYKGIYSTLPTFPVQMTIELYYRKILTYQGEIVEFYFNDITSTRMVESEKAVNNIRSLVLAKISHEFKVPLITIIYILKNYLNSKNFRAENPSNNNINNGNNSNNNNQNNSSIMVKTGGKNSISAEDYIRNTIDLGDYMLSLINDIIDYSIINSEFDFKCEYENFEFSEMMEFSFRILKVLLTCKGLSESVVPVLEIDSQIPQFFCNDEKRIKQILLNLITNSIKFTKKGFIKLSAYLLDEGAIKVSVEDTGCGIEPKIVQRIFNDIYTPIVNNDENFQKSTSGLGLSISKKIIDKIGSKIECSSIVNQKTVFSFIIVGKEEFENNFDKNDNLSYIDENLLMNRSGFTTSYSPINNNNNLNNFNNNNFNNNNNLNSNNFNNNNFNNSNNNFNNNNFSIKSTNLSERNNINQFNRMKAEMNINRRQPSPGSKMNPKPRRNSNKEVYYFNAEGGASQANNSRNPNNKRNSNNANLNLNLKENSDFKQTAGYEEEPTILQSPRDIPSDLGEITKNNRGIVYNNKKDSNNRNENYYELKNYIKPILKYFESQKSNLVLFVDDNEIIRKSVKRQVLSYVEFINDADVICCKDGAEAFYLLFIDQISNNRIKIIVSDDKMDLVDGEDLYSLIDKYTQAGKIRRIPFVLSESKISEGNQNVKKISEFYFMIRKNPKKEDILKLLEIAKIK